MVTPTISTRIWTRSYVKIFLDFCSVNNLCCFVSAEHSHTKQLSLFLTIILCEGGLFVSRRTCFRRYDKEGKLQFIELF